MAIKIIEQPKLTLVCTGCKAKLEFEPDDLVGCLPEKDWTSDGPEGAGLKCPRCDTLTVYTKATGEMIERAWKKKRAKP